MAFRPALPQWLLRRPGPHTTSLILALYIGGVLNAAVYYRYASAGDWVDVACAALAAVSVIALTYCLLTLFAFGGKLVYRTLAAALAFFSAAASYYMTFFNVVIGYGVVVSVLTLDTDLSQESLGFKFLAWLLVSAGAAFYLIFRMDFPRRALSWAEAGRRAVLLAGGVLVSGLVCAAGLKSVEKIRTEQSDARNEYLASVPGTIAHTYLPSNWISGLGLHLYQLQNEARNGAAPLFDPARHFRYAAAAPMDDTYVVFVLGETTRHDHMSLFGYPRETTPWMEKEKNLVALKGVSCDTATKLSMRCMFVREGGVENDPQRTLKEKNVFAVLKSLGFSSELYSMQSEVWFYNSINADSYEMREMLASAQAGSNKPFDDMVLVPQLAGSLARHPKGRHLVVLHTKGSHYLYSQRYPREFARYQPECQGIDAACTKEQLINAFDNSVLYVDYVLKNAIDQLRDKKAILIYAADHGESIDANNHFHATPREIAPPEQFRVPMLVWASDAFLRDPARRDGFARLKALQAAGKVGRHEELFDSILGCLGYTSPDGGINPRNNWCGRPVRAPA